MAHEFYIWAAILGLGVMTLMTRSALVVWPRPVRLPDRLQRALRFAPMAAIAAIVAPALFAPQGAIGLALDPRLIAACAVVVSWWFGRHMGMSMLAGLAVYVIGQLAVMNVL
jgi:branched-subunit amino acid transport protein